MYGNCSRSVFSALSVNNYSSVFEIKLRPVVETTAGNGCKKSLMLLTKPLRGNVSTLLFLNNFPELNQVLGRGGGGGIVS